jgi:hypothetical protein
VRHEETFDGKVILRIPRPPSTLIVLEGSICAPVKFPPGSGRLYLPFAVTWHRSDLRSEYTEGLAVSVAQKLLHAWGLETEAPPPYPRVTVNILKAHFQVCANAPTSVIAQELFLEELDMMLCYAIEVLTPRRGRGTFHDRNAWEARLQRKIAVVVALELLQKPLPPLRCGTHEDGGDYTLTDTLGILDRDIRSIVPERGDEACEPFTPTPTLRALALVDRYFWTIFPQPKHAITPLINHLRGRGDQQHAVRDALSPYSRRQIQEFLGSPHGTEVKTFWWGRLAHLPRLYPAVFPELPPHPPKPSFKPLPDSKMQKGKPSSVLQSPELSESFDLGTFLRHIRQSSR